VQGLFGFRKEETPRSCDNFLTQSLWTNPLFRALDTSAWISLLTRERNIRTFSGIIWQYLCRPYPAFGASIPPVRTPPSPACSAGGSSGCRASDA